MSTKSTKAIQQIYDEIPYPDLCYTQTHPDRLAALATLLGLTPPDIAHCRVLEIGCAVGGNLIPMAISLPTSEFVGIDISSQQIKVGQTSIRDLELTNVTLHVADIMDISAEWGQFDYIIAHGMYSWVPVEVRDKLMTLCKENLSPNGIAYISYNVYPGWHMMGALREMMLYHIRGITDPHERAIQARQLLDFLQESVSPDDPYGTLGGAYHELLKNYRGFVTNERSEEKGEDMLLMHDELALINDPCYFHEFVAHAQQHGLQYLVESELSRVMPHNFPPPVAQKLAKMSGDTVEMEQYMDFLRNRSFRQTLLCHAEIPLKRGLNLTPDAFSLATYAIPVSKSVNIRDNSAAQFRAPDGAILTSDHPVTKAAMVHLSEVAPTAVSFRDLLQVAREEVYGDAAASQQAPQIVQDAQLLAANILKAYSYSSRLVELHVYQPRFTLALSEKPVGSQWARRQLNLGRAKVTNLRHERVTLDDLSRFVLYLLDGEHTQTDIVVQLVELVERGEILLSSEPGQGTAVPEAVASEVTLSLKFLARAALIVA